MSNILWEAVFIIVGSIICLRLLNKTEMKKEGLFRLYKIVYMVSLAVCFVIVELSSRGAMLFGDGYDYYTQAMAILSRNPFNIHTMLDFQLFTNVSLSWHFIPTWEFTLFEGLFHSTRCLAIFHVILTNIASLIWLNIFTKIGLKKSGLIASIILVCSLYVRNFTTPALKDALVYFLFTVCVMYILEYRQSGNYTILFKLIIPLLIMTFTRMYMTAAIMVSLLFFMLQDFGDMHRKKVSIKKLLLMFMTIVILMIGFIYIMKTSVFEYANSWVARGNFGIQLFLDIIKRFFNFVYGPLIINIRNAQSLYYPSYIAAFIRLLLTPALFVGIGKIIRRKKEKKYIVVLLVIPLIVCMAALSIGDLQSSIRQYLSFYPLICIILGLGLSKGEYTSKMEADR